MTGRVGKQTCVLVLGMHRSGTSVLAGSLAMLGVDFGGHDTLLVPGEDNPKGYFEHATLVKKNISFLESFGCDSDGVKVHLPVDWVTDERAQQLKEDIKTIITTDFSHAAVFGLKDPRISILLPIYLQALQELDIRIRCVIAERPAMEVASSLYKRNQLPLNTGVKAHEYFMRMINAYTENLDPVRVSYAALLAQPKETMQQVARSLRATVRPYDEVAENIEKFIDPQLKHETLSAEETILRLDKELMKLRELRQQDISWWTEQVQEFSRIGQLFRDEKASMAQQFQAEKTHLTNVITKIEQEWKADQEQFEATLKENEARFTQVLQDNEERLTEALHAAHEKIGHLETQLGERNNHIQDLQTTLMHIERSVVWKVVRFWDKVLSLFIPRGSLLRNVYEKILGYIQHGINDFIPGVAVSLLKKNKDTHTIFWKQFKDKQPQTDVLFVNHEESRTGAPRVVFEVAQYYKQHASVAMVSLATGSMQDEFQETFGPVLYPKELYPHDTLHQQAEYIIEQVQPRVVYVNSISSFPFAQVAKEHNIPVVFHVHELDVAFKIVFSARQRRMFKTWADHFIAVSQPVYDLLVDKIGCPPEKVHLVHAFVNRERIQAGAHMVSQEAIATELQIKDGEILVLGLGMFIYRKGADIFMRLAKRLTEKGLPVRFVWIGSKPFKEPFMADFKNYKQYFTLLNEKENPFPYVQAADIFVLPSREDPFPLVMLEAMALQKSTVLFDKAGGIGSAVKDSGIHVDDFDENMFADAVESLVLDAALRKEFGERAAQYQEQYDSSRVLPKIASIITDELTKTQAIK